MLVLKSPEVAQETMLRWKREHKLALVPTMGCLHAGHLALVERAREYAEKVAVSIFVNPLQFGPNEDFEKYPRTFQEDCAKLEAAGVDLLLNPSVEELYPEGFETRVRVGAIAEALCGQKRPGHFEGVATICLKLFQIAQPDFVIFGEKDFQQTRVLQQMISDFNLPIRLVVHPTVREEDGLALSSRNTYLTPDQRAWASRIPAATQAAREARLQGASVSDVLDAARGVLSSVPLAIEYLEIASAADLKPRSPESSFAEVAAPRLFVAVRAGGTRLIDNVDLS